jgi:hypothetical protein
VTPNFFDLMSSMPQRRLPDVDVSWLLDSSATTKPSVKIDGVTFKIRDRRVKTTAPLAAITAQETNVRRIFDAGFELDLINEADLLCFRFMCTPELADAHIVPAPGQYGTHVSRGFSDDDIELCEATFLEPDALAWCHPAFKVPKAAAPGSAASSRFVTDGSDPSAWIDWTRFGLNAPPPMDIDNIRNIVDCISTPTTSPYKFGWECDGRSFFYGLPIHPELGLLYGVALGSKRGKYVKYRHTRVPMGATWAPFCAQQISKLVLRIVQARAAQRGIDARDFKLFAWIDNFFCFATTERLANELRELFEEACAEFNLTLKAPPSTLSYIPELLGLSFDLARGIVTPSAVARSKIADRRKRVRRIRTCRDFLTVFGLASWVNYTILRTPLCLFPAAMGALRQACADSGRTGDWDAKIALTEAAMSELEYLLDLCEKTEYKPSATPWPSAACSPIAWTDANGANIAGLLQIGMSDTRQFIYSHELRIYEAELMALVIAHVEYDVPMRRCISACDNTSAVGAFLKGHSANDQADHILRAGILAATTADGFACWVPTDVQRADKLTRLHDPSVPWVRPHRTLGPLRRTAWRYAVGGGERGAAFR